MTAYFKITILIQVLGSKTTNEDIIKVKTEQSIQEMQVQFESHRSRVLQDVIQMVVNITPATHENLR